jgi:alpha-galactosidase
LAESGTDGTIVASQISGTLRLNAASPATEWESAQPVCFSTDWQGQNSDPELETEVRALWSAETLYVRFKCRYRQLFVFEDSDPDGRRNRLWDRDVAEAFLKPNDATALLDRGGRSARANAEAGVAARPLKFYKEFEVAPNGMWIDLDISPTGLADLKSGLTRSVYVDAQRRIWTAELAIPMKAFTANFDPHATWRGNFYRVEGKAEARKYMAWQPTMTPQPNFHVPEAFGTLRFNRGTEG